MITTLVMPSEIADEIKYHARLPLEFAAVLLARRADLGGDVRLLARSIHWVDPASYIQQSAQHMLIRSDGYVPALGRAESDGAVPIWFHTHPGDRSVPMPSRHDEQVDREIANLFQLRSGSGYYGTLIASPRGDGFIFSGTLQHEKDGVSAIDRIWTVGDRWRLTPSYSVTRSAPNAIFDRHVRAFGADIQTVLGDLRVAIVGAGGTGSAIAEQLVRLGVRHLLLVDADDLSASNVTRVYGSTPRDVGRPKIEVLRDHLQAIAPDLDCQIIGRMATLKPVAQALAARDLVFGCTDDNAGRLVLSRLSTYFLLPIIDVGVLLSSDALGMLKGIDGRVTALSPGSACLVCRNRIDLGRASAELKTPEERKRLADEGYAPALGQTEPAVVAFTTAVAAIAVNELLDRLLGYGPPGGSNETLLRLHEREISTNRATPHETHYCHPSQGRWGAGLEEPFLGQLWPTP
ncbi:ThiF family adenylyltransferase [Phyllobacterium chamaecytisi]|uniref:ThiF family adenylyltransferase n=1 Tax=Phyllobacterium chamaecytisi TaxID=2876082 RepID=UPI001CCE84CA|nr:ThiF family adenylyltransferase [Phyllobacterium sp. KW56]MBZ9603184.1 ThiF family adenylyltransferase [Phyllobacterium sp. KW56]